VNETELHELAAGVFGISSNDISCDTSPEDLPQWDSLNHLHLITAYEAKSGIRLTMQQIQSIEALGDFLTFSESAA
jgi:acyl carrier protein